MKECNLILPNFKTKMKTKYLKILILIAAFFIAISSSFAQEELTVAEKKALKKEIKAYKKNPELYKDVKVKNEKKIAVMETELESLRNQLSTEWSKVDSLKNIIAESEQTIDEFEKSSIDCGQVPSQGTVYSVQIGNFNKLDLRSTFNTGKGLRTENYTGGNAYLIGNFNSAEEAIKFADNIKKLGITNAFVTQYIDGSRNVVYDAAKGN
jgi:predicted RNase H-like nuclease (RuvC/YqgF family)